MFTSYTRTQNLPADLKRHRDLVWLTKLSSLRFCLDPGDATEYLPCLGYPGYDLVRRANMREICMIVRTLSFDRHLDRAMSPELESITQKVGSELIDYLLTRHANGRSTQDFDQKLLWGMLAAGYRNNCPIDKITKLIMFIQQKYPIPSPGLIPQVNFETILARMEAFCLSPSICVGQERDEVISAAREAIRWLLVAVMKRDLPLGKVLATRRL